MAICCSIPGSTRNWSMPAESDPSGIPMEKLWHDKKSAPKLIPSWFGFHHGPAGWTRRWKRHGFVRKMGGSSVLYTQDPSTKSYTNSKRWAVQAVHQQSSNWVDNYRSPTKLLAPVLLKRQLKRSSWVVMVGGRRKFWNNGWFFDDGFFFSKPMHC